jgi:hypothetical protein
MESALEREPRVTPLELFFDLVFVFGFTQVTSLMSADPTARGVLHGAHRVRGVPLSRVASALRETRQAPA